MIESAENEVQERLERCFATVFPDLSEDEVQRANHASVANWDSLATVTLVSVIEEEFDISIEPEEYESFLSFDLILNCLKDKMTHGKT